MPGLTGQRRQAVRRREPQKEAPAEPNHVHHLPAARTGASLREVSLPGRVQQGGARAESQPAGGPRAGASPKNHRAEPLTLSFYCPDIQIITSVNGQKYQNKNMLNVTKVKVLILQCLGSLYCQIIIINTCMCKVHHFNVFLFCLFFYYYFFKHTHILS